MRNEYLRGRIKEKRGDFVGMVEVMEEMVMI